MRVKCVHWRRRDFVRAVSPVCSDYALIQFQHKEEVPSVEGTARQVIQVSIKNNNVGPLDRRENEVSKAATTLLVY